MLCYSMLDITPILVSGSLLVNTVSEVNFTRLQKMHLRCSHYMLIRVALFIGALLLAFNNRGEYWLPNSGQAPFP